ncbi:PLD nuclease N-terminal domain-containing protein [Dyadobacter sp. CY326]|uniref:PLD nuclease N-terminal domain-containing protein n=1 Tax=Dyadobacter sp. CY326 TaxID=2907300 RepID=UPI0038D38119
MSNPFAAIFGLGNQEVFLISCFILFFAFVVWAIIDLMSNSDYSALAKLIWMVAILFLPVFGTLFYLYYGRSEKHLSKNS